MLEKKLVKVKLAKNKSEEKKYGGIKMKVFKRIKKVLVATLIAAMTLGAVTGCSSGGSDGGDSKTLNFGCTNFSDSLDPSSIVNGNL